MAISPARQIAFQVLHRVATSQAHSGDLLHAKLTPEIRSDDARLATEITMGVLRWQRRLDFELQPFLKTPARLDREVQIALRMGAYQLRFLERVPGRAAVHESVELAKRAGKSSAAGLLNAVLRRLASTPRQDLEEDLQERLERAAPSAERLGIWHSHPTWMVERWLRQFDERRVVALLEANNGPAQVALRVRGANVRGENAGSAGVRGKGAPERVGQRGAVPRDGVAAIRESLRREGIVTQPGKWLRNSLRVRRGDASQTAAYRLGQISIQDEASQVVALLLGARPGDAVLDVCAAPGGKTAVLSEQTGPAGRVIAGDLQLHRLRAMQKSLKRLEVSNVAVVAFDAAAPAPLQMLFDRILVDAPCSGSGTLARNPEIRWRLRPEDLPDLQERQIAITLAALGRLAAGGRLLYATCSLEPEENEQVIEAVLQRRRDIRRVEAANAAQSLAAALLPGLAVDSWFDAQGAFRTYPPESGTDGFFAVGLEKK